MQDAYGLDASDTVLQKTPFSFDVSVWEFLWPLMTGARLVLAKPEGHRDADYLAGLIRDERVTTLHFVPSMLAAFLEQEELADACASVRRVVCSGEALSAELADRFFARMPAGAQLHNLYGPTEAAVDVTYWPCARDDGRNTVPIGRPVANTRIYVLDADGAPTPTGVQGELMIAGVQVGRGYLDRPALTAEKWIPDPFAPAPGARMYRSGDLARWTSEGALEYLGRMDHQVKVRGFRIELGEIEAVLDRHPAIHQAAVLVDEGRGQGEAQLVAYWVPAGATLPEPAELRAFLGERLPDHMVPAVFVPLATMPLTPAGKIDRRALPALRPADAERPYLPPSTPTEEQVAMIWGEVMGQGRVSMDDNFFAVGGHSLLATQMMSRLRKHFGIDLQLGRVFDGLTVAALARTVDELVAARPQADADSGAGTGAPAASGAGATIGRASREGRELSVEDLEALLDS
jgi:acyl-coenzyme A synthetase/AMP-(fatty) acid ligase/acyl carrier protein